jgi:hypothetical protein
MGSLTVEASEGQLGKYLFSRLFTIEGVVVVRNLRPQE